MVERLGAREREGDFEPPVRAGAEALPRNTHGAEAQFHLDGVLNAAGAADAACRREDAGAASWGAARDATSAATGAAIAAADAAGDATASTAASTAASTSTACACPGCVQLDHGPHLVLHGFDVVAPRQTHLDDVALGEGGRREWRGERAVGPRFHR